MSSGSDVSSGAIIMTVAPAVLAPLMSSTGHSFAAARIRPVDRSGVRRSTGKTSLRRCVDPARGDYRVTRTRAAACCRHGPSIWCHCSVTARESANSTMIVGSCGLLNGSGRQEPLRLIEPVIMIGEHCFHQWRFLFSYHRVVPIFTSERLDCVQIAPPRSPSRPSHPSAPGRRSPHRPLMRELVS